jgi:hypothetical protein
VTDRTVSLLFIGALHNNHYDAPLPVEQTQKLGILEEVFFHGKSLPETFSLIAALLGAYSYSIKFNISVL